MFGQGGKMNKSHFMGIAIGVGATVAGFYLYKKNKNKVDAFLKSQGINIKTSDSLDYETMSIEDLTETKERIEDLIAEKQLDENQDVEEAITIEEEK